MMKITLTLCASIFCLSACNDKSQANSNDEKPTVKQVESIVLEKNEPVAKTITIQEVSRIALIEAKGFLTQAKNNQIDFSSVQVLYDNAQAAYEAGDFKKAQKIAVDVRQQIELLLQKK